MPYETVSHPFQDRINARLDNDRNMSYDAAEAIAGRCSEEEAAQLLAAGWTRKHVQFGIKWFPPEGKTLASA